MKTEFTQHTQDKWITTDKCFLLSFAHFMQFYVDDIFLPKFKVGFS
jgi:hypothetical protein